MRTKIKIGELLKILKENRSKHKAAFEDACEGYREKMMKLLNSTIDKVKSGEVMTASLYLQPPEVHLDEYDAVIKLLELSQEQTIELDADDVNKFVLDDWEWKDKWRSVTNSYAKTKI